jgi:hypothetical protein
MKPFKSIKISSRNKAVLEIAIWEGGEFNGKTRHSSLSVKVWTPNPEKPLAFLSAGEALKLANLLENFAFQAQEMDFRKKSFSDVVPQTSELPKIPLG